ncbi:MAG: C-terminal binding protein [Chloroflexota bacterium]|nr:C-terminal binding protein [Chloroflexota bacterium]
MTPYQVLHIEAEGAASLPIERAALATVGATLIGAGTSEPAAMIAAAQDADVILSECSITLTRSILTQLPRCQAVVMYAIGLDHADLAAATEQGIIIAHTPGFCMDEVSNHALLFVLACARKLRQLDRAVRDGWWPNVRNLEVELLPMGSLRGQRLGLLSFGAIARSLAGKAQALGLHVAAYDPYVDQALFHQHAVEPASLNEIIERSDYLSIHTPLTPGSYHLIGEAQLRRMKPTAFLINTSRGAIVDEAALICALQAGWIAGAALDVFEQEPPAPDNPLLALENVIVTPHTAYCSDAAYVRVRQMAAAEAVRVLRGEWPLALANPAVKGQSRMEKKLAQRLEERQ